MDMVSPKSKIFVNFVNFKVLSILLILILILNCVFICNLVFLNDSQVGENAKKLKESLLEREKCKIRAKTGVCEILQPKRILCEISISLRNRFAT